MLRVKRSSNETLRRVATVAIALLLIATAVPVAAAQPSIYLANARVSDTTVAVGQTVTVTGVAENLGNDSGGYTMTFKRNGSRFASKRVVVEAGERTVVTRNVSFDTVGTYRINVNDRTAGVVRVDRVTATELNDTGDRQEVEVRAGDAPVGEPYRLAFPTANQTIAVENWTLVAQRDQFVQRVVTYDSAAAADVDVPSDSATVLGVVTTGSTEGVDAVTMQIAIDRGRLRDGGLTAETVGIYHRNGSTWEQLNTSVVTERAESVVIEARADTFSTFAVGRFEPRFEITNATFNSENSAAGQRILLDGTIANDGAIAGQYEADMIVNGETVNTTTVTVPANESRSVSLWYDVTESDRYRVRLNDRDVGTLIISESQVRNGSDDGAATATERTTAPSTATTAGPPDDTGDLPGGIPSTVLGIDTLYLAGGVGAALVVFLLVVVLLRRGGGGPGGSSGDGGGTGGFERL
ncbi:PGF-pre-PGF domain-containing protein [Haloarcula litorea]|uniref:PGF-pre-PGF domain-containing protein n=1 Tax=Haloarcula litorea TaxID=3032579 RepID=UPI0023E898C9|nr:PGF-pre-PGF domain-containing protein [Halomicroarcula sp. GDY20]